MMSTALSNEKPMEKPAKTNPFRQNFLEQLIRNKKITIMIFILHLTAAPLTFINVITKFFNKDYAEPDELMLVLAVISTALAALAGIVIAINTFDHLCKRSRVDMSLSLPLSTNQKFFSDFLGGLAAYLAPFFVAEIIGLLITGLGFILCEGKTYVVYKDPIEFEFFKPMMPYYIQLIIGGAFIMLMVYALTVLVMSCCGSMFECIFYTAAANGIIPAMIACFTYLTIGDIYGVDFENSFIKAISTTSPGGGVFGLLYVFNEFGGEETTSEEWKEFFLWLIPLMLVTAVMLAGAFLIYRQRRAEQVGRPFAFRLFYHIIAFSVIFCLISVFDGMSELGVGAFITCAVIYMIMEVVANRGFKRIWLTGIRFVGMVAAVLIISTVSEATDGFGTLYRVPSAGNVSSITIDSYRGQMEDYPIEFTVKSPENIQRIIDIHKGELERYRASDHVYSYDYARDYDYEYNAQKISCGGIKIEYHLKTGGKLCRTYNLALDEYLKLLEVERTDEYKTVLAEFLSERVTAQFDNLKAYRDMNLAYYNSNPAISVSKLYTQDKDYKLQNIPADFGDKLAAALYSDIMEETDEEFYRASAPKFHVNIDGMEVTVYPHYKNTVAYLASLDMLPETEYNMSSLRRAISNEEFIIASPSDRKEFANYTENGFDKYSSTLYNSRYNAYNSQVKYLRSYYESESDTIAYKLTILLENASSRYITEESCYTLNVSGEEYVIPPEYTELAEELYDYCYTEDYSE
ncbi:MAG: hypothetical protein J5999_04160 [Oscillospiraceae bacterium]|nr:hypothetical protein [Oscillospiraceae bacterium]